MLDNNEEEEEDRIPDFAGNYGAFFYDTAMGEPEEDAKKHVVENDLGLMLRKGRKFAKQKKESKDLKRMLEDYRTLLYPDCKQSHKNWVPHWNCCNERNQMVCLPRNSRSC